MSKVYLTEMQLIDFKSFSNITLEFKKGLNVIEGPNGIGKTSILDAFKVMSSPHSYSKKDRMDIVKHGCDYSKIHLMFSDSTLYSILVTLGGNVYFKYSNESKSLVKLGSEPPKDFLKKLGVLTFEGCLMNSLDNESGKFLIDTDSKYNDRVLKMLLVDENTSNLIENLETIRIPSCNSLLKDIKSKQDTLNVLVNKFKFTPTENIKDKISKSDMLINILENLNSFSEKINNLERVSNISIETIDLFNISNILYMVENRLYNLERVQELEDCILVDIIDDLHKIPLRVEKVNNSNLDIEMRLVKSLNNINTLLSDTIKGGDISKLLKSSKEELNSILEGGEMYECPINGKIVYKQGKCLPYN